MRRWPRITRVPHCRVPPLHSLTSNSINDAGTTAIAEGLRVNAALAELRCAQRALVSTLPSRSQAALFSPAPCSRLDRNNVDEAGADALARELKFNAALSTL